MPTTTADNSTPYGTILYATGNANVRNGPHTTYEKVGSLATGQQVTALGSVKTDGDVWVMVGAGQWVAGKLLADKPPAVPTGGGGGTSTPPYTPPESGGSMGTVAAAAAALAAGYLAYRWASKKGRR